MKITIVKDDNLVMVDGIGLQFPFEIDANIWSIQWQDNEGEIEYVDETPNLSINDFTGFQYLIDAYNLEKIIQEENEAQKLLDDAAELEAITKGVL